MNQESILGKSGLSKKQLAYNLGVSLKSVYRWKESPPKYAIAYLEQYTDNQTLKQGRRWMRLYLGLEAAE